MQEAYNYIKQCRQSGMSDDQIKENLRSNGWDEFSIEQAFSGLTSSETNTSSAPSTYTESSQNSVFASEESPQKKSKQKIIILSIISFISLLVIGGALLFYFFYYPKIAVNSAMTNFGNYDQAKMDAKMNFNIKVKTDPGGFSTAMPSPEVKGKLGLNGYFYSKEGEQAKSDFNFNLSVEAEPMKISTEGEAIVLEDETYIKLNRIPEFLAIWGINPEIENQWVSTGKEEKLPEEAQSVDKEWLVLDESVFEKFEKKGSEEVNGRSSYKYSYNLDKEAYKEMILNKANEDSKKEIEETFDAIGKINGEVFISKFQRRVERIVINLALNPNDEIGIEGGDIGLSLNISERDKKYDYKKPEGDIKPLEDMYSPIDFGI